MKSWSPTGEAVIDLRAIHQASSAPGSSRGKGMMWLSTSKVNVTTGRPCGPTIQDALDANRWGCCYHVAGSSIGGVWVYEDAIEDDDLLGTDRSRPRVHSSIYRTLRTNLPREIMGVSDFPFTPENMGERSTDARRYCGHVEVSVGRGVEVSVVRGVEVSVGRGVEVRATGRAFKSSLLGTDLQLLIIASTSIVYPLP